MKHLMVVLCCVLIVPSMCATTITKSIDTNRLNTYLERLCHYNKFMGSVCIDKEGLVLYSKSVGYSDVDTRIEATNKSRYCIGSISKSMTSVMIFQAIERGKLSLSTTLDTFFPSIGNADRITIDQMLNHSSGIHNFTDTDFPDWNMQAKSRSEMVDIIERGGNDFEPGSQSKYSNSNYVLLSYILEILYNKPFGKILDKNIVQPLKLTDTFFGEVGKHNHDICNSYKFFDKWRIETRTHPWVTMGAGGIVSTPRELNQFFEALFDGKLVSDSSLAHMMTIENQYGRGLFKIPFYNKIGYGHTGGIDGFNSVSIYFPEDKIAYSLTSNGTNFVINDITLAVLSVTLDKPFDEPNFEAKKLTISDLDKYLGVYSTPQIPIKLTVFKQDSILFGQGTGQQPFVLTQSAENVFTFKSGGIVIEFQPQSGTMILRQGGGSFFLKKE